MCRTVLELPSVRMLSTLNRSRIVALQKAIDVLTSGTIELIRLILWFPQRTVRLLIVTCTQ